MAMNSKNGSNHSVQPTWKGNFGHWNPHVIAHPLNAVKFDGGIFDDAEDKQKRMAPINRFVNSYNQALELLRAIPGTKTIFEEGVPLCPVLLPKMESLKEDDIRLNKVGGYPDLSRNWHYNYRSRLNTYLRKTGAKEKIKPVNPKQEIENLWPRCGQCHQYMSFVGQFDLTDVWEAIHRLTCTGDRFGHFTYSSVGLGEEHKFNRHGRTKVEWTFWACGSANEHYYSQNMDACIWTETSLIYSNKMKEILEEKDPDPKSLDAHFAEVTEVAKNFYKEHKIKHLIKKKRKVLAFDIFFDLDFGYNLVDWKVQEKIEKVMEEHPKIFAYKHGRQFKLFGEPESQQGAARYFSMGYRESPPKRMSPVLCWDDDEHDMTYQMYSNLSRYSDEGRRTLQAKIESSCT